MIGYIVDECHETWTIQLANGETNQMQCDLEYILIHHFFESTFGMANTV